MKKIVLLFVLSVAALVGCTNEEKKDETSAKTQEDKKEVVRQDMVHSGSYFLTQHFNDSSIKLEELEGMSYNKEYSVVPGQRLFLVIRQNDGYMEETGYVLFGGFEDSDTFILNVVDYGYRTSYSSSNQITAKEGQVFPFVPSPEAYEPFYIKVVKMDIENNKLILSYQKPSK